MSRHLPSVALAAAAAVAFAGHHIDAGVFACLMAFSAAALALVNGGRS